MMKSLHWFVRMSGSHEVCQSLRTGFGRDLRGFLCCEA